MIKQKITIEIDTVKMSRDYHHVFKIKNSRGMVDEFEMITNYKYEDKIRLFEDLAKHYEDDNE